MGLRLDHPRKLVTWLAASGAYFLWLGALILLLGTGRYQLFLRPGFFVLLLWALGILLLFLLALIVRRRHLQRPSSGLGLGLSLGILVLPLLYLVVVQGDTLGSHAFKNRSFTPNLMRSLSTVRPPDVIPEDGKLTLLEILLGFKNYEGKRVVTEGMVYRDEVVPEGHFLLFRFLIICCVADALPAGALVAHEEAGAFEQDTWVEVEGLLSLVSSNGLVFPHIQADRITPMNKPGSPYLFPGIL
jgi:uncharacterized repeat protein (TIGR03943 family)